MEAATWPMVTVVVPAFNCAAFLSRCLGSLLAQTYPPDRYEVVLVDDGSTDGTAAAARARTSDRADFGAGEDGVRPQVRVIEKANGGPASARNAGIRAARGEIVAFTDSDCVAHPDWLEHLVAALATDPEAAAVGGPILSPPSTSRVVTFLARTGFYRHRVRRGTVDYLLTANVAFRRSALDDASGFAERFGAWGEDADLSFRLRSRGHRLAVMTSGAVMHHGAPPSARALARALYRYGYGSGVLSRNWQNGRTPPIELARHSAAALLAPVLALRHVRQVGLRSAVGFTPLFALEHGAFVAGLLHAEVRQLSRWIAGRGPRRRTSTEAADEGTDGAERTTGATQARQDLYDSSPQATPHRRPDQSPQTLPLVSVLMPVRNEAAWIARSLGAVLAQDYPPERLEVLLIDGDSQDETLRVASGLAGWERVRVLNNRKRRQAAGMNLGIFGPDAARGDVVVRVDGHSEIAPDYVRSCVDALDALTATGAANVGGRMEPAGITPTGAAIALATTSRFGVPTAFHRSAHAVGCSFAGAQETDTVYLGAWPRAVLERVGGFDESLVANEDYELNYRIRRAGGRIYLSPAIRSTYYGRQTLAALARQYYTYGRGKAAMLRRHPVSLRPRQLAAPAFVAALVAGPVIDCLARLLPESAPRTHRVGRWLHVGWLVMIAAYGGSNLLATLRATRRARSEVPWRIACRVPAAFLAVHVAWGAGFWAGLVAGPVRTWRAWRVRRDRDICSQQPDEASGPSGRDRRERQP